MEYQNTVNNFHAEETVTCGYADIYVDNNFCYLHRTSNEVEAREDISKPAVIQDNDIWISPSDNLIDIVDLQPPLTSKITKGKTHEGILSIGDSILECDRKVFDNEVESVLNDNNELWNFIMENKKKEVIQNVNKFFEEILRKKSAIMMIEISTFYQKTLSELEEHMKSEIKIKAQSLYITIVTQLNNEIKQQLQKEKLKLEKTLDEQFNSELNKINTYYELLLKDERFKYNILKNKLIQEKNDALKAFYKQMEAECHTSTMFVLSLERKKCKMRKILLEKFQNAEVLDHLRNLEEKGRLLEDLDKKEVPVSVLNKQWEERIVKILQLFLKFISFCLKLLPEQTTFLLDFEKMVILQLNEMQKKPYHAPVTLITDEAEMNTFDFHQPKPESPVCDKEPFTLVGDLSIPPPLLLAYGSKETIDSDVDLPHFRVQRRYVYAKCHGFEEIKKMLEVDLCNCKYYMKNSKTPSKSSLQSDTIPVPINVLPEVASLNEKLDYNEIKRLQECPNQCGKSIQLNDFSFLDSYLDYTEENYEKVKPTKYLEEIKIEETVNIKDIAFSVVPFSATGEKFNTIGTQCSSEEDINFMTGSCVCENTSDNNSKEFQAGKIHDVLLKRERSLNKLLQENPKLINLIFSDECYENKI